ncbi:MAG: SDR family oxidoreductase [Deltaproteobacteria bacterium]|nr:SDR family oxidoreductase [Deltaproteobacteria bacterium]
MRVLITGGAGFIGSHIAERFVKDGHEVRIIDNLSSGHVENLAGFRDGVTFTQGDIRNRRLLEELCEGCELVYHEAAVVSVPYSVSYPQETHDVNIQGTLNVLEAARAQGVRRVVFAGSAAVYGEEPTLPKVETMAAEPIAPYGVEKITSEYYCRVFNQLYGLETVTLRYFNVFGPRQDPSSAYSGVISIFVDRALSGRGPVVFGDGEQSRDFVFVDNVVQANMLAGQKAEAAGRVYNVGLGKETTLNQLLAMLGRITGKELVASYAEARAGDIRESVASIQRISTELGYDPRVPVEEGLRRLVDSLRNP